MAKSLPTRPHLDHLRAQAKTLLADLKAGLAPAARAFMTHLPAAKRLTPARVRAAGFKLADAQSVVARQSGFDSWSALVRHVEQLRALEGEWRFTGLEIDGAPMPAGSYARSRLFIDGDRFRMASAEAVYDGTFTIDASVEPMRIDIAFVEGPEAGRTSLGIFALSGDQLTMCLGLAGASRPAAFVTSAGRGHALERLRRASTSRPANVTGGTRAPAVAGPDDAATGIAAAGAPPAASDVAGFDVETTPLLGRLAGVWSAISLVIDGQPMQADWLPFGSRTTVGNEVKVVFGGQTMLHARMRFDETATPVAVDYLNLSGGQKGRVSAGIMDWVGDDVRFLIAAPGQPRPTSFAVAGQGLTLSQWRRRS